MLAIRPLGPSLSGNNEHKPRNLPEVIQESGNYMRRTSKEVNHVVLEFPGKQCALTKSMLGIELELQMSAQAALGREQRSTSSVASTARITQQKKGIDIYSKCDSPPCLLHRSRGAVSGPRPCRPSGRSPDPLLVRAGFQASCSEIVAAALERQQSQHKLK